MIFQNLLEAVFADWSYFDKEPDSSIRRDVLGKLGKPQPDIILAVQGVRRCGKSTLLAQIMTEFGLAQENCFFINFEDPRLSDVLDSNLLSAIIKYADQKVGDKQPRYFFFDEVQNVKDWEKWLRLKVDRPTKDCFVITGSNASLLSGDLATVLTGRYLPLELFPFSFTEYQILRPESSLLDYLQYGGFPRPLREENPHKLLRQYFIDIIERDVRRYAAGRSLTQLAKAVYESTGSELSARGLSKRIETATDTVLNYLDALSKAYLILPCPYFTFSERKRLVRNTKWYPIDCGMMHSISSVEKRDIGKSFETAVFHALRVKYGEVFYWREQGEVDFIVLEGNAPRPVQASWDGLKTRHVKAIEEFQTRYPNALDPVVVDQDNFAAM